MTSTVVGNADKLTNAVQISQCVNVTSCRTLILKNVAWVRARCAILYSINHWLGRAAEPRRVCSHPYVACTTIPLAQSRSVDTVNALTLWIHCSWLSAIVYRNGE